MRPSLLGGEASRARLGRWLLAAVVVVSALGLGALHTTVLAGCAVVAMAATALVWFDAEPLEPRPAASVLVAVALGLIGWTALSIVPLPRELLASLASENADVWARCLSPLRQEGPAYATISLDPTASRVQILRGVTYLVVFVGALRVARRQEGVVFLERTLVFSAVLVGLAALMHPALGATKVFGLYEPKEKLGFDVHHLAPLLNTNHLAGYLNIGLAVAFAAVVARRESMRALPRTLAIAVVILLAPTIVWTFSRGGTGAMVLGMLVVGAFALFSKRGRRGRLFVPALVGFAALVGGLVLVLAAFDPTRAKFARHDYSKINLALNALSLVRSYPLFGVGRGAFESAFQKEWKGAEYYVNTHPENVVAQWTTEWGVPVAVAAMAAIAWALRPRSVLSRSRPPVGPWAALVAVSVHNFVDFSSEVPGVMIALSVCAAVVTGGRGPPGKPEPHRGGAWSRRPLALSVALAGATALAMAMTLPFTDDELYTEQRAFRDVGLDRSLSREQFHVSAREAMLRHPAEPYFPYVGAVRATVVRDESVLPWAGRVLERSPVHGRVHLLLARSLFTKNPSQARLEYRLACEQDSTLCQRDEALRLVGSYDDAVELVPEGPRGAAALEHLTRVLEQRLPASVVRLDRELLQRDPNATGPILREASAIVHDIKTDEPWCSGDAKRGCIEEGVTAARRLQGAAPLLCDGYALMAELRIASGEPDAGFAELDRALDQVAKRSECAQRLVLLARDTNQPLRLDAALDRLLKLGCERPEECVQNLVFAAEIEAVRGSTRRSLALSRKAWERAPERDELLVALARKASAQGFHGEALDAYSKLAERHPDDPQWRDAVQRERDAVARGVLQRR